jgi:hypothetical protein
LIFSSALHIYTLSRHCLLFVLQPPPPPHNSSVALTRQLVVISSVFEQGASYFGFISLLRHIKFKTSTHKFVWLKTLYFYKYYVRLSLRHESKSTLNVTSQLNNGIYRVFQKELYNFESLEKFIQRTYTTF